MSDEWLAHAAAARRMEELREQASAARRRLRATPPPHLAPLHAEAVGLTEKLSLATARNMSAAFVGIFTTGKSLLASLLVGMPELLAVANIATTGNVTRLILRPAPPGTTPRVRSARLSFLSRGTTAAMVSFVLEQVAGLADRVGLPPGFRTLHDWQPVDMADPARSDWSRLERLLRPIWNDRLLNLELKQWATELFQVRDALEAGHALLAPVPGGSTVVIDEELLDAALRIGDSRNPPSDFPEPAAHLPLRPHQLTTPERIRTVLPLIHEVVLELDLPQDMWSFGGLTVDLLDFPGLASDSLRDQYLSHAELGGATVMVVVVDAKKPKQRDVTHLDTLLSRQRHLPTALTESIVTVVNRFDRLTAPTAAPTTPAELSESEDIAAVLQLVTALTRNRLERMAITSALAAAAQAGFVPPDAKPSDADAALSSLKDWAPTAAALGDGSAVAQALSGYVRDGGVGHLRRLLSRHLGDHGVAIWVGEAEEIARQLQVLLALVYPAGHGPASDAERDQLVELCDAAAAAHRVYTRRFDELRLVNRLPCRAPGILEELRDEAVRIVYAWDEWVPAHDHLVTRVRAAARTVTRRAGVGSLLPGSVRPEPTRPHAEVATDTAVFAAKFGGAIARMDDAADRVLRRALSAWTGHLVTEPAIAALSRLTDAQRLLEERLSLTTVAQTVAVRMAAIRSLFDVELISGPPEAAAPADLVTRSLDLVTQAATVPLAPNRALPWHPLVRERMVAIGYRGRETSSDPVYLIQLRTELTEALVRHAVRRMQEQLDIIHATVGDHLDEVTAVLPTVAEITTLIQRTEDGA